MNLTPIGTSYKWCLAAQSCPTLGDPMDCSPPGSSVPGDSPGKNTGVGCHALLQGSSQPRDWAQVSHTIWQIVYSLSHQRNTISGIIQNLSFCAWLIALSIMFSRITHVGAVLRWRRNRMGRPLSPSQIHQKNISVLSKFHKTTSECWLRTSGTQKSRSLSSKTGRKKYKRRKKRQKR